MPKAPTKPEPKASLQLGPLTVHSNQDEVTRMAIFLWGTAGIGKTTFAGTMPGKKLWLSMGDNEHASVMHRNDVQFVKLYDMSIEEFFRHAQSDNPFGLDKFLAENTEIESVIFDSATALAFRALQRAIERKVGAGRDFQPSIETPGISAYGARNGISLEILTGLLRVTAKHNVHFLMTGHEADPTTRKDGANEVIDYIGVMLGGQLVNNVSWRLSEIWYMSQQEQGAKHRQLAIRTTRKRKPMKTRMFVGNDLPEFPISYDPYKPDNAKGQMTIASFYHQWLDNGNRPIPIPKV